MRLYVLYDAGCGLCSQLVQWISKQPASFSLQFVAAGSDEARRLFPEFQSTARPEELVVISEDGSVYRDEAALAVLGKLAGLLAVGACPAHGWIVLG